MANRIQHKRSSIAGRRPDGSYLEPGEIALNTSGTDPGVYFEASDGSIIKAGPASISSSEPVSTVGYGQGEAWFDSGNKTLSFFDSSVQEWVKTQAAPYGGSRTLLYVGSQFPEATDSLANDGNALPFASLNRASMEIARRSILQNRLDNIFAEQFVIILLPGINVAFNEPGMDYQTFQEEVSIFKEDQDIDVWTLRAMNPEGGGVILPRGASIVGFDARKTTIIPSYYPKWTRRQYEDKEENALLKGRTNVIKWTGGSYLANLGFRDKKEVISVANIYGEASDVAVLESATPHGFRSYVFTPAGQDENGTIVENPVIDCDTVTLVYPENVSQSYEGLESVPEGQYHVEPISPTKFYLRNPATNNILLRRNLPFAPDPGTVPQEFFTLTNAHSTHHRLTAVGFASANELSNYYAKVQRAFANLNFNGEVNNANVTPSEINIISIPEVTNACEGELSSIDDTTYASPKIYDCELRTNWGLNAVHADGSLVGGFKSVAIDSFSIASAQNDPDVYEVYYDNEWLSLKEAYFRANNLDKIQDVTDDAAMEYLIQEVDLSNFRIFYRAKFDLPEADDMSSGLPEDLSDCRNYGLLASNGSIIRCSNSSASGCNVNIWSKNGGAIDVSGCATTFGTQSLRAEGFRGIGTNTGAEENMDGFVVKGIRRPALVSAAEVEKEKNLKYLYLNANIVSTTSTTLTLSEQVNQRALLPYTLRPGTAIWVTDASNNTSYKAILASTPVEQDLITLNVESAGNEIDGKAVENLSPPFIRRFVDPRPEVQRNFSLWVENTDQTHQPPSSGSILRYAELAITHVKPLIVTGKQLDPGQNGGWNHVFSVHQVLTKEEGNNPNLVNPTLGRPNPSSSYYLALKLGDGSAPWTSLKRYARGDSATYKYKPFVAETAELQNPCPYLPTDSRSVFSESKQYEYALPTELAYQSEGYKAADDPDFDNYVEGDTYLRGIGPTYSDYAYNNAIDLDNGTPDMGIIAGNYVSPTYTTPEFSYSKAALARFLRLLGYETSDIDLMLVPQKWSERNLAVSFFPDLGDDGYAQTAGEWPISFNSPSLVVASNHRWEYAGYFNYSKGLPRLRTSHLSARLTFDSTISEAWGGAVRAQGLNDAGEFITNRVSPSLDF